MLNSVQLIKYSDDIDAKHMGILRHSKTRVHPRTSLIDMADVASISDEDTHRGV